VLSGVLNHGRRHAIAYVALFLTLGGGSAYAAFSLPKGSVGTKQIRNGAVTLGKISGSAKTALQGQRGPRGPQGSTGPQGPGALAIADGAVPATAKTELTVPGAFELIAACDANADSDSTAIKALSASGVAVNGSITESNNDGSLPSATTTGAFAASGSNGSLLTADFGTPNVRHVASLVASVGSKVYTIFYAMTETHGTGCYLAGTVTPAS
jgi:hypothetical protein